MSGNILMEPTMHHMSLAFISNPTRTSCVKLFFIYLPIGLHLLQVLRSQQTTSRCSPLHQTFFTSYTNLSPGIFLILREPSKHYVPLAFDSLLQNLVAKLIQILVPSCTSSLIDHLPKLITVCPGSQTPFVACPNLAPTLACC